MIITLSLPYTCTLRSILLVLLIVTTTTIVVAFPISISIPITTIKNTRSIQYYNRIQQQQQFIPSSLIHDNNLAGIQHQQRRKKVLTLSLQQPYNDNNSSNNNDDDNDTNDNSDATTTTFTNTKDDSIDPQQQQLQSIVVDEISSYMDDNSSNNSIQYIGSMEPYIQQITFVSIFIALGFGTQVCIQLWYNIAVPMIGMDYFHYIQTTIFPILFGIIFTLVGIAHFVFVQNFARIVPPYNCWGGLWKLPAPYQTKLSNVTYEEYHSYTSGIIEFIGGIWLLYTGINENFSSTIPATILFLVTIAVTPANIYMFTHNASPGGAIPQLKYPYGHLVRFILQCGLLSNFYIMMNLI